MLVVLAYYQVMRPDLRGWSSMKTHGNAARREIALTFDDGPHPLWTPLLADTLERHGARGTFFLVGIEAERYPELTARLVRGGHQIGNHSLTHPYPNLTVFPRSRITREICDANRVLASITHQPITYFRPPGGDINNAMLEILQQNHLDLAWWSENVGDWSSPTPEQTVQRLNSSLRPGLVILMHQRANSVVALEEFLAVEHEKPYTYTTFTQIMR